MIDNPVHDDQIIFSFQEEVTLHYSYQCPSIRLEYAKGDA
jgi:hypothetical protein